MDPSGTELGTAPLSGLEGSRFGIIPEDCDTELGAPLGGGSVDGDHRATNVKKKEAMRSRTVTMNWPYVHTVTV